jgi:THO complex subunit 3
VSWNSQGAYLAAGLSYERTVKIYSFSSEACRLFCSFKHTARVEKVRFHPDSSNVLLVSSDDRTVKLWDVRLNNASVKAIDKVDLKANAVAVSWSPTHNQHLFAVCDSHNGVHIYDSRTMTTATTSSLKPSAAEGTKPIRSFDLDPHKVFDATFSPSSSHLVLATRSSINSMGILRIFPWDEPNFIAKDASNQIASHVTFQGHTAAMTSLCFSPNGRKLLTGGQDSVMALWDVRHMVCTSTSLLRNKSVRSVTLSFDSKIAAGCCYDEDGIDLMNTDTGKNMGTVSLAQNLRASRSSSLYGCSEIAFHPKTYVLACARGDTGSISLPAVNIATIAVI